MPLSSYSVESPVYIGPPPFVKVIPKKIAPENIKSNQGMAIDRESTEGGQPTVRSYGHAPQTVIFKNGVFITRSSNNTFATNPKDFYRNGPITQIDDYRFGSWVKAGTAVKPAMFDVILPNPHVAYGEGITPLGMFLPNPYDTQVNLRVTSETFNAIPINKTGYYTSKIANLKELLRNSIFDAANRLQPEAVEWIKFLADKGYSIGTSKESEIYSLGIIADTVKEGILAFYDTKSGTLGREADLYEKAKRGISRYGLTDSEAVQAFMRAIMFHEIAHRMGIKGDAESERLQGYLQHEFYSRLAQKFKGARKGRIYEALAREGLDYAAGYEKSLADIVKGLFDIKGRKKDPVNFLVFKLEAEAAALEIPYHLRETYIRRRLEEMVGPLIEGQPVNDYNTKSRRKAPNKKYAKKLEELVEGELVNRIVSKSEKAGVYKEDAEDVNESDKPTYKKIDKSEYKNMKDVGEREGKAESAETDAREAEVPTE
ncbi:hypothetical protein HYX02_04250 [Candidatus Woesearchaeota archaeon]|nr:hypothetical protein [Candidatus Woesearchaeota archaeon]